MPPLRIVIVLCYLLVCALTIMGVARDYLETITESDLPLGAAAVVAKGDEMTIRINAPKVNDLYGYQFRLEYDNEQFSASKLKSLID